MIARPHLLTLLTAAMIAGFIPAARAAEPAVTLDLSDPGSALTTYFKAQKANDLPTLDKIIIVTDPAKKHDVDVWQTYQLWARYLERQCIAKFGKDDGLSVEAHGRSLDDQSDLDIKRALDVNLEYNLDHTTAKAFLRIEKNRPPHLQLDRFQFLDVYFLVKTPAGWKIDYLKTYKCDDPEQAENYKAELGAYPRMSWNLQKLSADVKAGKYKSAVEVKNMLGTLWDNVYDQPTDASGRTQKEAERAEEKAAARPAATQNAATQSK